MSGIEGPGVIGGGGGGAPTTSEFVTVDDETSSLPNSRQLVAGTNVTFDTTTPGELAINASGGAPAGSDGQIQYNDAGAFGASAGLTFASNTLTVGNGGNSVVLGGPPPLLLLVAGFCSCAQVRAAQRPDQAVFCLWKGASLSTELAAQSSWRAPTPWGRIVMAGVARRSRETQRGVGQEVHFSYRPELAVSQV